MKLTVWGGIVVAGTFLVAHPAQAQELNAISKVDVKVEGQKTTVVVTGSRRPTFQAYTQKAPPRVVLDLVKSTLVNLPPSTPQAKGQLLTEVRATQMGAAGRELAQLELVFAEEIDYQVDADGSALKVSITRHGGGAQQVAVAGENGAVAQPPAAAQPTAADQLKAAEQRAGPRLLSPWPPSASPPAPGLP